MPESRASLKRYFETGDLPSESQFASLIDSMYNKSDDALADYRYNTDKIWNAGSITIYEGKLYLSNKETTEVFKSADWTDILTNTSPVLSDLDASDYGYTTVGDLLNYLLNRYAKISNFVCTPSVVEKGQVLNSAVLSWDYNEFLPESLEVSIMKTSTITVPLSTSESSKSINTLITNDLEFILKYEVGNNITELSSFIKFKSLMYWGVSSKSSLVNNEILQLTSQFIDDNKVTISANASTKGYIYIAYPKSLGKSVFVVDGLETSFLESEIQLTNSRGYVSTYYIYRSIYKQTSSEIIIQLK